MLALINKIHNNNNKIHFQVSINASASATPPHPRIPRTPTLLLHSLSGIFAGIFVAVNCVRCSLLRLSFFIVSFATHFHNVRERARHNNAALCFD